METFELEPNLHQELNGSSVNVVVRPMWIGSKHSLAATLIHGQTVMTDLILPHQPSATIFQGQLEKRGNRVWIVRTPATVVVGHAAIRERDMQYMRETCSGLGAVSTGYAKCGVVTSVHNDSNRAFSKWLSDHGKKVIHGDINDVQVIQQMAQSPGMFMSAGVSCQPFSYLGDMKQQYDDRSRSLPGTLRASYLMQSPVIILECTPGAERSEWVQHLLRSFAAQTGFRINQKILELHTFWVSRRTRWWCTLSHAALGIGEIPAIPKLQFCPTFLHLFPKVMDVSESDLEEISLDLYELRYFHGYPSLHKHLLDPMKALPTATHSWGSQVKSCSCGCRKGGFSLARLEEKGLYGVITPTGGEEQCGANLYCKCRHLHACEIALANGLHPSHVGHTKGQCRLEMAGVGQMASPFQGAWVLANVLKDIHLNAFPLKSFQEPMDVMQTMAIELLRARDELLGYPKHTPSNEIFHQAIQQWGQSNPLPAQVPSQTTATVDAASEQKLFEAKHPSKNPDASEAGLGSASHTPGPVDAHRPDVTIDATKGAEPVNNAPSLEPKAQKKLASETGVGTTSVASEATVQGFVHSSDASDCTDHVNRAPPVEPKARSQKAFEAGVGKTPEASEAADQGFKHRSYAVDCTEQMHSAPTVEPKAHILQASEAGVGKAHEASVVYDPGLVHCSHAVDCTEMDGHECKKAARPSVQNFRTTNAKGAEVIRVAVPTQAARFARSANASVHKPDVTAAGSLQTNPRQSTAWPGEVEGNGKQQKPTKPGLGPVMPSTLMPPPQHPDAMPLPRLGCGGPSHVNEPNQGKSHGFLTSPR